MIKSYLHVFILILEAIKTQKKLKTGTRILLETQWFIFQIQQRPISAVDLRKENEHTF